MTKTITRVEIAEPEIIVNDAPKLHETWEPGDVAHQGDVMFVCLASLPESAKPRSNRQLAEGNTQGSRHVMTRGDIYDCDADAVCKVLRTLHTKFQVTPKYVGPVFVSPENPTCDDLTHPEHGNHGFPAGSVTACVYQRNLDSEQREMRAMD